MAADASENSIFLSKFRKVRNEKSNKFTNFWRFMVRIYVHYKSKCNSLYCTVPTHHTHTHYTPFHHDKPTHLTLSESEASGRCLDAASSSLSWLTWSVVSVTGPSGVTPSRGFRGCWKMSDRGTVELSSDGCRDVADSTAAFSKPPAEGQGGEEAMQHMPCSTTWHPGASTTAT